MNIQESITELQSELSTLKTLLEKQISLWTFEEISRYCNDDIAFIELQLTVVKIQMLKIELLNKPVHNMTDEERDKYSKLRKRKGELHRAMDISLLLYYRNRNSISKIGRTDTAIKPETMIPLKRKLSSSSVGSQGIKDSELTQQAFRNRIVNRDINGCILTGRDEIDCQACYIIPWNHFQKDDLITHMIFDTVFPYSCNVPEHRVMDVRNGILLWWPLIIPFDALDFTILRKVDANGVYYVVETLTEHEFLDELCPTHKKLQLKMIALNDKKIRFNPEKQNEWPGEKFLKVHNEAFYKRREELRLLKSQAKVKAQNEMYCGQTLAEKSESNWKIQHWLAGIDDSENFVE
ncbi:hypothetical protein BC833DRAFT_180624 [Globomyces pollinis-pini]|nr:hypothetical protein BC833DRAFT_180624 [Globomyces pollinis-pini]